MNWKRSVLASAIAVPVVLLFAWGMTRDPGYIPSPLPGRAAPSFALEVFAPGKPPLARPAGDTVRLDSLRGNVVVVNFWASWCLACRDEHVELTQTAEQYVGAPVRFLGVLYMDEPANGVKWIADMGGQSYPSVTDPRSRTAIDYGLYGVPETFILDAAGRVAYKQTGPITNAILTRVVDSLLAVRAARADTVGGA